MKAELSFPKFEDASVQIKYLAAAIEDVASAAATLRRRSRNARDPATLIFVADGLDAIHNRLDCRLDALIAELKHKHMPLSYSSEQQQRQRHRREPPAA